MSNEVRKDWATKYVHYCHGKWIPGTAGFCSAGYERKDHVVLLAREVRDDE